MRKSIYLLTTTPSSHTHRFHPLPLATPTSCSPHPLATPIHSTHSPQLSSILFNLCKVQSMDDNCGEWVECMGVATGCGCKKVYRFPHSTYPYSSCICSFLQQHPYFLFIFLNVSVLFCNYILCILNNFFTQYKHTYGQLRASHGSHMKVAHTVLYMKKHTQTYASYPAMDISCMSVV